MALALRDFDPWRDAHPDEWRAARLVRPKRPPDPLTPPPFTRLLGLAAVDSLPGPIRDEPLPRAHAPWLLPERVEVWTGTAWAESAIALTALSKRTLYLPADWPDETDDRTGASGCLRVTYPAGPAPLTTPIRRVLTARATVGGAWLVDGQPVTAYALGPYAPAGKRPPRGVHPWAVVTATISAPSDPLTIEIDTRGSRFSQLLLALSGAP
ncbi:hypothetical protein [Deinococcus sp. 6GRE01]|uniref:hypothetical protein n=1 Tax=Deinococcus sp. 6GRE01 TaxID=2745873 RepID=UPI001E50C82D|nr:hypothetical protein [Deinococcus sp. 6GRE01]MCD0159321.1 hypothetical protein [Deinococcus sp. 6GRE01]